MADLHLVPDATAVRRHRLRELGRFLSAARSRLTPETVGLPSTARRRTPGLRREEVAGLAGVSPVWYTWLEQGRDVQVSASVLAAVGRALRLSGEEWDYVRRLSGPGELLDPPPARRRGGLPDVLHELAVPAIRTDRRWTVVDCNTAAVDRLGFCGPSETPNLMRRLFLAGDHVVDGTRSAAGLVGLVRGSYARHPADGPLIELIDELRRGSTSFGRAWDAQSLDLLSLDRVGVYAPDSTVRFYEVAPMRGEGPADGNLLLWRPVAECPVPAPALVAS